jgi:hypothetical protein
MSFLQKKLIFVEDCKYSGRGQNLLKKIKKMRRRCFGVLLMKRQMIIETNVS